jgi:hypothetical protein
MKIITLILALSLTLFILTPSSFGNDNVDKVKFVIDNTQSTMSIQGGSNVRSWDAEVTEILASINAELGVLLTLDANRNGIFSLSEFRVPVKKIDSGNNGLTRNIHKYLNEKEHPEITFILNEAVVQPMDSNQFEVLTKGIITAAGADKEVEFILTGKLQENGSIILSGISEMTFSDFNIDRPSAMLGTVRAHDEIEVHFSLVLVKE